MENNKKNNGVIIGLLIGIIIMLVAFIALFATNTISFTSKATTNESGTTNTEENNTLSNDEAISVVKNIFSNSTVQYLLDEPKITYCNTETKIYSEEELGIEYKWNGYQKCTDYKSYEELSNYFKSFFTEEYYNNTISKYNYVKQSNKMSDGSISYNYYEKDGSLYAAITGKGSDVLKDNFQENKSTCEINELSENSITATINAIWFSGIEGDYSEKVKMTLKKNNDKWLIDSYQKEETN